MSVHIHKQDGVDYIISAKREGGSFFAFWTCDGCNVRGGSGETFSTERDAIDAAKVNLQTHHKLKHSPAVTPAFGRRKLAWILAVGVIGAFFVYVATCVDLNDWEAIQGKWETVNVTGNGIDGDWSFQADGLVQMPSGYRTHYSMNPLLHTITCGNSYGGTSYGTYKLDGNDLKIYFWDKPQTVWTLKKVRSY
jgi:hypothetical protein